MTGSHEVTAVGLALPFGGCPLPGVATAGQPTEEQLDALKAAGYRTVLDLRPADEPRGYDEPAAVRQAGLDYIELPVTGLTLVDATFHRFRDIMRDPERRPIVVHCKSANRVGALMLPYLMLDERRSLPDALEAAEQIGLRSPEMAHKALDYVRRNTTSREDT